MSELPPALAELLAAGQITRLQVVIDLEIPTTQPETPPPEVRFTIGPVLSKTARNGESV